MTPVLLFRTLIFSAFQQDEDVGIGLYRPVSGRAAFARIMRGVGVRPDDTIHD